MTSHAQDTADGSFVYSVAGEDEVNGLRRCLPSEQLYQTRVRIARGKAREVYGLLTQR